MVFDKKPYEILLERASEKIARTSLEIGAIKLRPEQPFQWASGYFMPIYNDNRLQLQKYEYRRTIADAFGIMLMANGILINEHSDVIAGVATSGISPATSLADSHRASLVYVRDKPKAHGMKNRIEGIPDDQDLGNRRVVLIEDLVSTGGSSVDAVQAIRDANGSIDTCLAIFSYNLDVASKMFSGELPYDKEKTRTLETPCKILPILTYETLLKVAIETGNINAEQQKMLEEWRADPFNWGENHGFPRVEK